MKICKWIASLTAAGVLLAGCADPGQSEASSGLQSAPDARSKMEFLPEAHSDTLFALIVDDWGSFQLSQEEYADGESFFRARGFAIEDAVRWELSDGELLLCWDAQAGTGCGIRRTEAASAGFAFTEVLPGEGEQWERWKEDAIAQPEPPEGMDEYTESVERDEAGRLIRYECSGTWADCGIPEPEMICTLQLTYDGAGVLRERHLSRNMKLYASDDSLWDSYYDEAGRLKYERGYITHGSQEYYYFYEGAAAEPSYILYLDKNCGAYLPQFAKING